MIQRTLRVVLVGVSLLAAPPEGRAEGVIQNFNSPLPLKVYAHYSSDVPDTVLGFTPVAKGHRIHINPGTFWYVRPQGELNAAKLTRLAKDVRHFGIPGLDLSDHWELSDESIRHLRSLPSIRLLDLSRTKLTNHCGPSLATMSHITILILPQSFTDRGLSSLETLIHLRDLSLDRTTVGNEGLKKIAAFTMLENLDLSGTSVTNSGLEVLRKLPHLKRLVLGGRINDDATPTLAALKSLQHIDISQTQITDQGLAALATLPKLESVYLSRSIGDVGVKRLADSRSLKSLDLSGSAMTDAAMVSLAQIKSLQELDVSQTAVTDTGVEALASLPNLRMLELSDTKVTHDGVAALSKIPHLDILSLSWQTLSKQDLQSMSKLHQVKTMILNGVPLPSSTMAQLRRLNHASPWERVTGLQHAQIAQTSTINEKVLTAPVAAKPAGIASVASLPERPLSAPLNRGLDPSMPIAPTEPIVQKPGFWNSHVKTIFTKSSKLHSGSADTLMAPQAPEPVGEVHPVEPAVAPGITTARLQDNSVKGGVSMPSTPAVHPAEDISGGASAPEASGPTVKKDEDNLLKAIVLQSDPSKHGGFSGLVGMKQIRAAEGSETLNALALSHDNRIDTQEDKPENSLGEIEIGAKSRSR